MLSEVSDPRKNKHYSIEEIVFGCISLFIFKCGSRNVYNNLLAHKKFRKNFKKLFRLNLPGPDTVAIVLKKIKEEDLEAIKHKMVHVLLEKRVFDKWRYTGKLLIAIDGSGIVSYDKKHCDYCLHKTYNKGKKNEKTVYYHNVLEAKLVTANGFSISIETVWIENDGKEYNKQDCEMKAFTRLAKKIKEHYPRTNICLCADGLYPNNTFFDICKGNKWDYIVALKDKSLKNLWKTIKSKNRELLLNSFNEHQKTIGQEIQWINNEHFNGHTHQWVQINETQTNSKGKTKKVKLAYLTNLPVGHDTAIGVCNSGRLRWKIEKQGFDQQKNHGYKICHKYCRNSYTGMKNYYQCCQIAHMINQLVELEKNFEAQYTPGKVTIKHLWFCLLAFMIMGHVSISQVNNLMVKETQIQYRT